MPCFLFLCHVQSHVKVLNTYNLNPKAQRTILSLYVPQQNLLNAFCSFAKGRHKELGEGMQRQSGDGGAGGGSERRGRGRKGGLEGLESFMVSF